MIEFIYIYICYIICIYRDIYTVYIYIDTCTHTCLTFIMPESFQRYLIICVNPGCISEKFCLVRHYYPPVLEMFFGMVRHDPPRLSRLVMTRGCYGRITPPMFLGGY